MLIYIPYDECSGYLDPVGRESDHGKDGDPEQMQGDAPQPNPDPPSDSGLPDSKNQNPKGERPALGESKKSGRKTIGIPTGGWIALAVVAMLGFLVGGFLGYRVKKNRQTRRNNNPEQGMEMAGKTGFFLFLRGPLFFFFFFFF